MVDSASRELVESEWESRLGVSRAELRSSGLSAVATDVGANAAMSFLFGSRCVIAVQPARLGATVRAIAGLDYRQAFTEQFLTDLIGPDAQVDGPSWHGYVDMSSFCGGADEAVSLVSHRADGVIDFLSECDDADVLESGLSIDTESASATVWALREHGRIVAAGNMTDWRGQDADVGVLTHPHLRGRGLASRVVATMVAAALPTAGVIRYRALATNVASLAVARRLGFEPFGQNYRARLRSD